MIRSMTGYGRHEGIVNGVSCTVEARCVNGRYLEVNARLPKEWADKEQAVRELVREHVTRGSLSVYIRTEDVAATTRVHVDMDVARTYVTALRGLKDVLGLVGDISLDHIVAFGSIFQAPLDDTEKVDVWPELKVAIAGALEALNAMRVKEGGELERDFLARLESIERAMVDVEARTQVRIPNERERLRERVRQIIDDGAIDEQRLQLEIVLLSDKLDVSEECVRLRSHIKFFRENLAEGTGVGRKLNFLLQEMNREVNTIGSKSNDAEIARMVIGMKEELERIREQVQNIE
jgi:uncharacterized protein (TIGR00255 family)